MSDLLARWEELLHVNRSTLSAAERRQHRTKLAALRSDLRAAGVNWPYAYTAPVLAGGECVECGQTDGGHYRNCCAVN